MGPLALNDMVGIDVGVHTFPPMHEGYGEKFPIPVLFEKLLQAGRLGLKSGKGIYVNGLVDDEFLEIIQKIQSESGIKRTEFSADRLILRQVNEAVCCLQEKIASAEGIDRAMVLPCAVDVKDGKIVRIRPLHYDSKYDPKQFNPWKITKNGKTLGPLMKAVPSPFSLAYKKRVYSPNRIKYPLKRVDWDPNGERNPAEPRQEQICQDLLG